MYILFLTVANAIGIIISTVYLILLLIGTAVCFVLLIGCIFFMRERVDDIYDIYRAKSCLKNAGISCNEFKKLSYYEQISMLRNTRGDDAGMLVKDKYDLETFRCIMKKEPKQ